MLSVFSTLSVVLLSIASIWVRWLVGRLLKVVVLVVSVLVRLELFLNSLVWVLVM